MNVNFIRTGVLISMNLDPEGVIAAAAGSAYDGVHTDTHTHTNTHRHTHINSKYIYIYIHTLFFFSSSDPKRLPWLCAYITSSYRRCGSDRYEYVYTIPGPAHSPWAISAARRINALIAGYIPRTTQPPEAPDRLDAFSRARARSRNKFPRGKGRKKLKCTYIQHVYNFLIVLPRTLSHGSIAENL